MNSTQQDILRVNMTYISNNIDVERVINEIRKKNPRVFNVADEDRLQRRLPGEHKLAELIRILEVHDYGYQLLYNGIEQWSRTSKVLGRLDKGIVKKKPKDESREGIIKGKTVLTHQRATRKDEISGAQILEGMRDMFASQDARFKEEMNQIKEGQSTIKSEIGDARRELVLKTDSLYSDIAQLRTSLFDFRDKVNTNLKLLSNEIVEFKKSTEKDKRETKSLVENLAKKFEEQQKQRKGEIESITYKLAELERRIGNTETERGDGNMTAIFNKEEQIRKEIQDMKTNIQYYIQATNQKLNLLEQRMQRQETLSREDQAIFAGMGDSEDSGTEAGAEGS
ncbi:uncharacterized protein LOC144350003 [Saccoglossus kowalevskii]